VPEVGREPRSSRTAPIRPAHQHGPVVRYERPFWSAETHHALPALRTSFVAHRVCNIAKSATTAAPRHLERWRQERAADNIYDLDLRQLSAARGLLLQLAPGTKLWLRDKELVDLDPGQVRAILSA
jgi:hypothetical protein